MAELDGGRRQLQWPLLSQMRLLPTSSPLPKFRPDPSGRRSCWRSRRPSCSWPLPPQQQPRPRARVRDRAAVAKADRGCLKTGFPVRSPAICASELALTAGSPSPRGAADRALLGCTNGKKDGLETGTDCECAVAAATRAGACQFCPCGCRVWEAPRACWYLTQPRRLTAAGGGPKCPACGPGKVRSTFRPPPSLIRYFGLDPSPLGKLVCVCVPAGRRSASPTRTARATSAWDACAPLAPRATTASRTPTSRTLTAEASAAAACPAAGVSARPPRQPANFPDCLPPSHAPQRSYAPADRQVPHSTPHTHPHTSQAKPARSTPTASRTRARPGAVPRPSTVPAASSTTTWA